MVNHNNNTMKHDWDSIPEAEPDEFDLQMLSEIEQDKDCHEFIPADEAEKMLGLS